MTAADRLLALAGTTGTAAALLLLIGAGATAGAALADYSGLSSGSAADHLLVERTAVPPAPTFTTAATAGLGGFGRTARPRYLRDDDLIWMGGRK